MNLQNATNIALTLIELGLHDFQQIYRIEDPNATRATDPASAPQAPEKVEDAKKEPSEQALPEQKPHSRSQIEKDTLADKIEKGLVETRELMFI